MNSCTVADGAAIKSNKIKALLANGLRTFFIKGNLLSSNGPKILSKNLPDCLILCN